MKIACDGASGCLGSLIRLKQQYPYLKVILSVGGGGPGNQNFAAVAASGYFRDNFAESAKGLIDASGLDGIDSQCSLSCIFFPVLKNQSRLGTSSKSRAGPKLR